MVVTVQLFKLLGTYRHLNANNLNITVTTIEECLVMKEPVLIKLAMLCTDNESEPRAVSRVVEAVLLSHKQRSVTDDSLISFFHILIANCSLPRPVAPVNDTVVDVLARIEREGTLMSFSEKIGYAVATNPFRDENLTNFLCTKLLSTFVAPSSLEDIGFPLLKKGAILRSMPLGFPLLKKAAILCVVAKAIDEKNFSTSQEGLDSALISYFYDFVTLVIERRDAERDRFLLGPLFVILARCEEVSIRVNEKAKKMDSNRDPLMIDLCKRCKIFGKVPDIERTKEINITAHYTREVISFINYMLRVLDTENQLSPAPPLLQIPEEEDESEEEEEVEEEPSLPELQVYVKLPRGQRRPIVFRLRC